MTFEAQPMAIELSLAAETVVWRPRATAPSPAELACDPIATAQSPVADAATDGLVAVL
jgi:hypothetical protein